jgi:NAD(P)-dependent dehydrogenase (short-subunit alcohol dehydrogenase family)
LDKIDISKWQEFFSTGRNDSEIRRTSCIQAIVKIGINLVATRVLRPMDAKQIFEIVKKVFLTGASSGIGLAIAKLLIAEGHEVWGTSRNLERIPKLPRLHPIRLDLADRLSIENAFNSALAEAGYLDVLINNAGAGHFGPAELLPLDVITSQFQILVFGQIQLMQLALRHMRSRGEGLIINVTSLASRLPVPFMGAYNSAKAALASFTMSIQLEFAHPRVRIVDLQPGDIRTEFNQGVIVSDNVDDAKIARTWEVVERNMNNAPGPEMVALQVLKLLHGVEPPPRVTVGSAFESKIAPLIFRFLPQRVRIWGLKRYYGI